MVVISESVHPCSLDFANQRKAVMLREQGYSYPDIREKVVNLKGKRPPLSTIGDVCRNFSKKEGRKKYNYDKCGRQAWKMTADNKRFVIDKLKKLRTKEICTSVTLQAALAKEKGVVVSTPAVLKTLRAAGYRWLPRAQKRRYSKKEMAARRDFAQGVVDMTAARLRAKLCMCLDGVVLTMPPKEKTARENYCTSGADHMWRKPSESYRPELAGEDPYPHQVPLDRALPMWGGVSADGFAKVLFTAKKRADTEEWVKAVEDGRLTAALQAINPQRPDGPWTILCDGEHFLHAKASKAAHRKVKVSMWKIPPRSPDLNPVEQYWSWLRRKLRALDLQDLKQKRSTPGKTAYKQRVTSVLASAASQRAAANIAKSFKKTCKKIVEAKGAGVKG